MEEGPDRCLYFSEKCCECCNRRLMTDENGQDRCAVDWCPLYDQPQ